MTPRVLVLIFLRAVRLSASVPREEDELPSPGGGYKASHPPPEGDWESLRSRRRDTGGESIRGSQLLFLSVIFDVDLFLKE